MSKDGSVAPKERINIKYTPATGDAQAEVELPFKTLVVGDFKGRTEDAPVDERQTISIDKNNFDKVLGESGITLTTSVANRLVEEEGAELPVQLNINSLQDFSPDSIAQQMPEIKKLLELREALVALKGPLGNIPEFRKQLQSVISSEESRTKLLAELEGLSGKHADAEEAE